MKNVLPIPILSSKRTSYVRLKPFKLFPWVWSVFPLGTCNYWSIPRTNKRPKYYILEKSQRLYLRHAWLPMIFVSRDQENVRFKLLHTAIGRNMDVASTTDVETFHSYGKLSQNQWKIVTFAISSQKYSMRIHILLFSILILDFWFFIAISL